MNTRKVETLTLAEIQEKFKAVENYTNLFLEKHRVEVRLKKMITPLWKELARIGSTATLIRMGDLNIRIGYSKYPEVVPNAAAELSEAYKAVSGVMQAAWQSGAAIPDLKANLTVSAAFESVPAPSLTANELQALLTSMPEDKEVILTPAEVKQNRPVLWEYLVLADRLEHHKNDLKAAWGMAMRELLLAFPATDGTIKWVTTEGTAVTVAVFRQRHYVLLQNHPDNGKWQIKMHEAQKLPGLKIKELAAKGQVLTAITPYITVNSTSLASGI